MKFRSKKPFTKLTALTSVMALLISLILPIQVMAQECAAIGNSLSDILAKKEKELADLQKVFLRNNSKFSTHELRYSKSGYVPLDQSARAKVIEDAMKEAGGEKMVFDLRLNSKANELSPYLRAHHQIQIVDPKIIDGKIVAKTHGTPDAYTIEIPLDSIDNLAFWKGLERSSQRKVVSFSDSKGQALADFTQSVGENKRPRDYTEAFARMKDDWNQQNDILAAIDSKVARGDSLSKGEFAVGLMVDRNRTSKMPSRLSAFEEAYDSRVAALKGSEPNADELLKDIPMDPSMRERATRLLGGVKSNKIPPAVIDRQVARTALVPIEEVKLPAVRTTGTEVVPRNNDALEVVSRPAVNQADDVLEGEIFLKGEEIPAKNLKEINPEARAHETGTAIAVREVDEPITIELTAAKNADEGAQLALESEKRLTLPAPERVVDDVPPSVVIKPEQVAKAVSWTKTKIAAGIAATAAFFSLKGDSRDPAAEEDQPAPAANPDPDPDDDTATPPPQTTTADTTLSPEDLANEFENLVIKSKLTEKTKNKPEVEYTITVSVSPETSKSKSFLESGHFELSCESKLNETHPCKYKADKGVLEIKRTFKRHKEKDYGVGISWLFQGKKNVDKEDGSIKIPKLDCANIAEGDTDTQAACDLTSEEYVPSFNGVTGPQLTPPPAMVPLKGRGVFITPGFN